jgi:hypothetical protein
VGRAFGHGMSERRACRLVKQPRGTQRYRPTQRDDEDALTRAIITLASQYGRFGYRRITVELQTAGWRSSHGRARDQNGRSWPARDRDRWHCCRCLACCSGQKVVWILHFKTQIAYPASSFHVGRRQRNHTPFLRYAVPSGIVASSAPWQLSTCTSLRVVLLFRYARLLYICHSQTAFFWRIGPSPSTSAIC